MIDQSSEPYAHGRLPWPTPDEMSDDQRTVYDAIVGGPRSQGPQVFQMLDERGRLEGPFNSFLVNPKVGLAMQEVGAALRYTSSLSPRQREIAILELVHLERCDFERYAHERLGRAFGLTENEITALARGADCSTFRADEVVVRDVVSALQHDRHLDDDLFDRAQTLLEYESLADVVVLVGYYQMLALSLNVWETPLPAGESVEE